MNTVPETVGQYRILDQIGAGGLGDVYRARDTRVGRTVAINLVRDDIASVPEHRARLLDQARRLTTLSHPGVASLYEVGEQDGRVYLAYEFVEGQTLKALVGGRPLNPRRAVNLACQIADGLAEAHAADLPHGALDLDAVVVTPKGRAKILNIGLASWASGQTPLGSGEPPTPQGDVSSLGTLLFAMLTGGPPASGAPVSRVIVRAIPQELDPIVSKALGENGGYESAASLAGDLRTVGALLDGRQEATDALAPPPAVARSRSSNKGLILLGVAVMVVAAALVWWYLRTG